MLLKSTITSLLIASSALLFSQVGVGKQYQENDTTRTFSLLGAEVDTYLGKFIQVWGTPDKDTGGNLVWEDISLPEVGEHVQIRISDGIISTVSEGSMKFMAFPSKEEKREQLENLQPKQYRMTDITITDQNKVNFVNTPDLEAGILAYLNSILQ